VSTLLPLRRDLRYDDHGLTLFVQAEDFRAMGKATSMTKADVPVDDDTHPQLPPLPGRVE
jgi:hypothetical protein